MLRSQEDIGLERARSLPRRNILLSFDVLRAVSRDRGESLQAVMLSLRGFSLP